MSRAFALCVTGILLIAHHAAFAENTSAQKGIDLAVAGRCVEAMPELDAAMRDQGTSDTDKRAVSTAGVRCSMLLNQQNDAMSFLGWLQQKYPSDPDILFLAVRFLRPQPAQC